MLGGINPIFLFFVSRPKNPGDAYPVARTDLKKQGSYKNGLRKLKTMLQRSNYQRIGVKEQSNFRLIAPFFVEMPPNPMGHCVAVRKKK